MVVTYGGGMSAGLLCSHVGRPENRLKAGLLPSSLLPLSRPFLLQVVSPPKIAPAAGETKSLHIGAWEEQFTPKPWYRFISMSISLCMCSTVYPAYEWLWRGEWAISLPTLACSQSGIWSALPVARKLSVKESNKLTKSGSGRRRGKEDHQDRHDQQVTAYPRFVIP